MGSRDVLQEPTRRIIHKLSRLHKVDPNLMKALARAESNLNPYAIRVEPHLKDSSWYQKEMAKYNRNPKKLINTASLGPLQILYVNTLKHLHGLSAFDLLNDIEKTTEYGILHYKNLPWDKIRDKISAYNAGHPTWTNYLYVSRVLNYYQEEGEE